MVVIRVVRVTIFVRPTVNRPAFSQFTFLRVLKLILFQNILHIYSFSCFRSILLNRLFAMLPATLFLFVCIFHIPIINTSDDESYYKLLGIEKNADIKEIRKAFKKLAVLKHPDKNKDDENAHENFLKLAEAYETLKDPEKRKHYDIFGKTSNTQSSPKYHSYSYYKYQFGIYDDDPLITTLDSNDFESSIGENFWFVNFYSPYCSHCHEIAPEWKELAKRLEGVVKIGAVNCEEDNTLCWEIPIRQFPTLLFFDDKANIYSGIQYNGVRSAEHMEDYVLKRIEHSVQVHVIKDFSEITNDIPWLLFLCGADEDCVDDFVKIKLAAKMKGLVYVGYTEDDQLIDQLTNGISSETVHLAFVHKKETHTVIQPIDINDDQMTEKILSLLPEAQKIDVEDFKEIRNKLRSDATVPWLLCFTVGIDTQTTIMLKKLMGILKEFNIGEVNCGRNAGLCNSLHITRYPTWGILKRGGAYEMHRGHSSLHSIERFALDTYEATNIHALSPQDVDRIMSEGTPWIVGFLLSGCPPCKNLIPALRKASNHFSPNIIQFGTIDCASHSSACSRYSINSFPTTILYNGTTSIQYQGMSKEEAIVDFINAMKANLVISLNPDNFFEETNSQNRNLDMYVIEFYAPWCGPCQRLQPEWVKLAHKLADFKRVKIGSVNCQLHQNLCMQMGIQSYPTIRIYPIELKASLGGVIQYNSYNRDYLSLQKWVISHLPSPLVMLDNINFKEELFSKTERRTWVVMFFAPWCGFCHQFEPEFIISARKLENSIIAGKVDCQSNGMLCQSQGIISYPTIKLYQRSNGQILLKNGITLNSFTHEELIAEIRTYISNAYITPLNHDEL